MERKLTEGSVLKDIFIFSLPYLLSYFLQTLYGMADLFLMGRFGFVSDITAVSVGSQVMHMLTVILVGLSMGTTVMVGRSVGAEKKDETAAYIGSTVTLFAALSLLLTALLLTLVRPIVAAMSTPGDAVSGTVSYLTICFAGIPFITAYNVISAIFRGLGDSKSPLCFVAIACVINILLDCLFMGVMHLGPAGAALGTTLSQAASVLIALCMMKVRRTAVSLSKSDLKPKKDVMSKILGIGVPIALQDGLIQVSFIAITIIANRRGLNDAAAVGIVEKIIGIMFLVPSSMLSTVSALAAQNIGANQIGRAKQTLWYAIGIAAGVGILLSVLTQFCAGSMVRLFEDDMAVVQSGREYLLSYVFDCAIAGIHFCFSGYFCAIGKAQISFLHNILSIVIARIPLAYLASVMFPSTLYPMGLAAPIGSLLSAVICVIAYQLLCRNTKERRAAR